MGMAGTYWPNGIPAINISGGWSFLNEGGCGCPITDPRLHLLHVHFCTKEEKLLVAMAVIQNLQWFSESLHHAKASSVVITLKWLHNFKGVQ